MKRFAIVLLLAATVVACRDAPTSVESELGSDIDLEMGEDVVFRDEGFAILFREVASDSRCPKGAACFWAGNAKIRIGVALLVRGPAERVFELNTYLEPEQASYSVYTIRLVALEPYPPVDRRIPTDAYVATLRVTRDDAPD